MLRLGGLKESRDRRILLFILFWCRGEDIRTEWEGHGTDWRPPLLVIVGAIYIFYFSQIHADQIRIPHKFTFSLGSKMIEMGTMIRCLLFLCRPLTLSLCVCRMYRWLHAESPRHNKNIPKKSHIPDIAQISPRYPKDICKISARYPLDIFPIWSGLVWQPQTLH